MDLRELHLDLSGSSDAAVLTTTQVEEFYGGASAVTGDKQAQPLAADYRAYASLEEMSKDPDAVSLLDEEEDEDDDPEDDPADVPKAARALTPTRAATPKHDTSSRTLREMFERQEVVFRWNRDFQANVDALHRALELQADVRAGVLVNSEEASAVLPERVASGDGLERVPLERAQSEDAYLHVVQALPDDSDPAESRPAGLRSHPMETASVAAIRAELACYEELARIATDFRGVAAMYGKQIINERHLPADLKTIQPIAQSALPGVAGGSKFLVHGVLFKFGDTSVNLYGGHAENAFKASSLDLMGCAAVFGATVLNSAAAAKRRGSHTLLHVPLMAVVSYRGTVVTAMSVLPISQDTLVLGAANARDVRASDADFNAAAARLAHDLNLQAHYVNGVRLYTPFDLEGHISALDDRLYMIDFARLFPCEALTSSSMPGSHLYKLLRPALVAQYHRPLCSDAFSALARQDAVKLAHDVQGATRFLFSTVIPRFVCWLVRQSDYMPDRVGIDYAVTDLLHEFGINARHLFLVFVALDVLASAARRPFRGGKKSSAAPDADAQGQEQKTFASTLRIVRDSRLAQWHKRRETLEMLVSLSDKHTPELRREFVRTQNACNLRHPDTHQPLLHLAIERGLIDKVKFLLDWDAAVDATDLHGRTALHLAVERENVEAAKALLNHGANVEARDCEGVTPLAVAEGRKASSRSAAYLSELLQGRAEAEERRMLQGNDDDYWALSDEDKPPRGDGGDEAADDGAASNADSSAGANPPKRYRSSSDVPLEFPVLLVLLSDVFAQELGDLDETSPLLREAPANKLDERVKAWKQVVLVEMVSRGVKSIVRHRWRRVGEASLRGENARTSNDPYTRVVASEFNRYLRLPEEGSKRKGRSRVISWRQYHSRALNLEHLLSAWRRVIDVMVRKFCALQSSTSMYLLMDPEFEPKRLYHSVDRRMLYLRLVKQLGVAMATATHISLSAADAMEKGAFADPLTEVDVFQLRETVKKLNITAFAEGKNYLLEAQLQEGATAIKLLKSAVRRFLSANRRCGVRAVYENLAEAYFELATRHVDDEATVKYLGMCVQAATSASRSAMSAASSSAVAPVSVPVPASDDAAPASTPSASDVAYHGTAELGGQSKRDLYASSLALDVVDGAPAEVTEEAAEQSEQNEHDEHVDGVLARVQLCTRLFRNLKRTEYDQSEHGRSYAVRLHNEVVIGASVHGALHVYNREHEGRSWESGLVHNSWVRSLLVYGNVVISGADWGDASLLFNKLKAPRLLQKTHRLQEIEKVETERPWPGTPHGDKILSLAVIDRVRSTPSGATYQFERVDEPGQARRKVVAGGFTGSLYVFDLERVEQIGVLLAHRQRTREHKSSIFSVLVLDEQREFVLTASNDHTIKLWDLSSLNCKDDFKAPGPPSRVEVEDLIPQRNGKAERAHAEYAQQFVRLQIGAWMNQDPDVGHTHWVQALERISNSRFASGSFDHTVRLYELHEDGPELSYTCTHVLRGHTDGIWALRYVPELQLLLSGGSDEVLRVWALGLEEPKVVKLLPNQSGDIYDIDASTQVVSREDESESARAGFRLVHETTIVSSCASGRLVTWKFESEPE